MDLITNEGFTMDLIIGHILSLAESAIVVVLDYHVIRNLSTLLVILPNILVDI